nr:putative mobilization protein MobB [Pseudomonas sp.]
MMAVAQEQQQAATLILKRLEAQQAELTQTISKARSAVDEMNKAGHASALIIEKSTRIAVEKAVQVALEGVQQQTRSALGDSVNPAVKALQGVTERAEQAEENLQQASRSLSWKWTAICAAMGCTLLATVVGLSMLLVPTPNEIATLRANVAALEARGGKVQLTQCGPSNRLCAQVDIKANTAKNGAFGWGKEGDWIILQGY